MSAIEMMQGQIMATLMMMFISNAITFFLGILPLLASLCGISTYTVYGHKLAELRKKILIGTSYDAEKRPRGVILGKWFVGIFNEDGSDLARIICFHSTIDSLVLEAEPTYTAVEADCTASVQEKTKRSKLDACIREGSFEGFYYARKPFYPKPLPPKPEQEVAIQRMIEEYARIEHGYSKDYCVSLLYGPPGTGKSSIAFLLGQRLLKTYDSVYFVDSFCPTDPGDSLYNLYSSVSPTKEKPMVVILEEVDGIIRNLKGAGITPHKKYNTAIKNKAGWNFFFDEFAKGKFPYVYFIMTSNMPLEWFNGEDASYMRDGRVDLKIRIG